MYVLTYIFNKMRNFGLNQAACSSKLNSYRYWNNPSNLLKDAERTFFSCIVVINSSKKIN